MDNDKKLFEGLLKADGIDPAGATESERIAFGEMLDQRLKPKRSMPGSQPGIWRMIMKTKTAKFATAAVIIFTVLLTVQHFTGSIDGASTVFAQMTEAMKKAKWMHWSGKVTWPETEKFGKSGSSEAWQSFEMGLYISKEPDGEITLTDRRKKEVHNYCPATGRITISQMGINTRIGADKNSPQQVIEQMVEVLAVQEGTEVVKTQGRINDTNVEIINITVPRGDDLEEYIIVADRETHLPLSMKLQGYIKDVGFWELMNCAFDYPNTGPTDIYALGVPTTAEIIDKRPTEQVASIINKYETARENAIPSYIAVDAESLHDEAGNSDYLYQFRVVYNDGVLQRKEKYTVSLKMRDLQKKGSLDLYAKIGPTAESVIKWLSENKRANRINLYDGEFSYDYSHYYNAGPDVCRKTSFFRNQNGYQIDIPNYTLQRLEFFELGPDKPAIKLIENEYSISNNLICLEKNFYDKHSYAEPHGRCYRMLCYLNPQKDYLCTRFEMHFVKDKLWQERYSSASDIAPETIEKQLKTTRIHQATELARTTNGKWYPKTIESNFEKELPEGGVSKSKRTYDIYLNDKPQFPDGIFEPATLPKQPD